MKLEWRELGSGLGFTEGPVAVGDGVVRRFTYPRGVHVPSGRKKTFQGTTRGLVNFLTEVRSDTSVGFGTVQYVPITP